MQKFGRVCKEYMVKEIAKRFEDFPDFFITTFSYINVGNIEKLRKDLKKTSALLLVVKNTLLKRAMKEAGRASTLLEEFISGSCGVIFSKSNPVVIARTLVNFSKDHESLKIRGGFVNGERISSDTVKLLATLPPKEVLLARFTSSIKAPISGFVGLLGNLLRNLVVVVDAISKKKSDSKD